MGASDEWITVSVCLSAAGNFPNLSDDAITELD